MNKIVKNPFSSGKEEKFVNFLNENGIKFKKAVDPTGRGSASYELRFEPPYIDSIEKAVVEHCEKEKIQYTFAVDREGHHHYSFSRMVDFSGTSTPWDTSVTPTRCMPSPIVSPSFQPKMGAKKWDQKLGSFEREYGEIPEPILEMVEVIELSWWQQLLCWFPPYAEMINARLAAVEAVKKENEAKLEKHKKDVAAQKKWQRDQLILAGVLRSDE